MTARSRTVLFCFVSFSAAQIISLLGDRLHQFSVVGMIGKLAPGSSVELLQFALFSHLPILLFAPIVGSLIDRSHKVAVLIIVDVTRGLLVLGIPAFYDAMGSLYAFYIPVFALSILNLAFAPAKSAVIPELFGTLRLLHLNAILWALGIIGTLAGFLLGGWLFDYHSWRWSFYVDGGSYLASVVFLFPLLLLARRASPSPPPQPSTRAPWYSGLHSIVTSVRDGFVLIKENRPVAFCLGLQAVLFALLGAVYVLGIAHIHTVFPADKTIYLSATASAGTVGLLAGAGLTSLARRRVKTDRIIALATFLFAVSWIGIALSERLVPVMAWVFAMGAAFSPPYVVTETLLQLRTPTGYRGRIFSTREILIKTSFLIVTSVATLSGALVGKNVAMIVIGVLLAVLGVLLIRRDFPEFRIVPQDG